MKKISAIIVFIVIFNFILTLFISCGEDKNTSTGDNPANNNANDTKTVISDTETPESRAFMGYEFPDVDYGGYEFKIIYPDLFGIDGSTSWAFTPLTSEGETGEVVNDAVFRRNVLIEDTLGITLTEIGVARDGVAPRVTRSVASGSNEFDMAFSIDGNTSSMLMQGALLELKSMNELSLGSPWWDQRSQQTFTIAGQLYSVSSPSHLAYFAQMWCVYFNKKLISDLALESPHDLVAQNRWNYDTVYELSRAAIMDLNGDGIFDLDDRWGIRTQGNAARAHIMAINEPTVYINSEGVPEMKKPTERTVEGIEKIKRLYSLNDGMMLMNRTGQKNLDLQDQTYSEFSNAKVLFLMETLGRIHLFRDMENDFGFVPMPKFDEKQESYYTWPGISTPLLVIPKTAEDPTRSATVANALTAVSTDTSIPAYYDIAVTRKALRDEESLISLDLMREGYACCLATTYGWNMLLNEYADNINTYSGVSPWTLFEKRESAMENAINKTLDELRK